VPGNGKELLAREEVFPRDVFAQVDLLASRLAYPVLLVGSEVGVIPRVVRLSGPRTACSEETVLLGGDGEDLVIGAPGRDVLIGGIRGHGHGNILEDVLLARMKPARLWGAALASFLDERMGADDDFNLLDR
jgi:hypothetical protein